MLESVSFRPQIDEDLPFLRRLYASTRDSEMNVVLWSGEQKSAFLEMQFSAQKRHYEDFYAGADFLVIESGGAPIGRLYVYRDDVEIHIIDIALVPERRRHGLGRELLKELLDEGRASGRKVTIYVEHFNPARHLYDRLGFRHIDSNGVYHLMEWIADG